MKTAEKEQQLLFSVLFVQKDFILLLLVIAKPLTVVVCVNIRIKFNLPYPYSFFLLFVCSLGCFPAAGGNPALQSCPEQPEAEYWSPTWWLMAHAAFLESFSLFWGALPPHWQFCCLYLSLCSCLGFFFSGIMVIKGKWVKSFLEWEKMTAEEEEAQIDPFSLFSPVKEEIAICFLLFSCLLCL